MTVCVSDERIVEKYKQLKSIRKVGKVLGISRETARVKLKALGILSAPVIHSCNDSFFAQDTPESFYWAGFIGADGCVKLHSKKYKYLSVGLAKKDRAHIEKFKETLGFTGPISDKVDKNGCESSEIKIRSDQLFNDLARFNIVPRKSLTYTFPDWLINHEYVNHFMRGYMDGDGSFYIAKPKNGRTIKQIYISLRGTKKFLTAYKNILEKECAFKSKNKKPRLNNKIYTLEYGGNRKVSKIRDYLYKNSTKDTRLDRKYDLAFDDYFTNLPINCKFKPVMAKEVKTGKVLKFNSMQETKSFGFTPQCVSACCRGIIESHKGYTWQYE